VYRTKHLLPAFFTNTSQAVWLSRAPPSHLVALQQSAVLRLVVEPAPSVNRTRLRQAGEFKRWAS